MLVYQCCKCNKTFVAQNPKVCPYCLCEQLKILANYRAYIHHTSDICSKHNKYSTKFDLKIDSCETETALPEILCNILRLPSISIRHSVEHPYVSRIKRCHSTCNKKSFEFPITVELRVYSPKRAYVLIDTEDEQIFDYLVSQYKARGWKVLDVRKSRISFVKIIKQFLKTHVIPRLKNDVVRKDIECMIQNEGEDVGE